MARRTFDRPFPGVVRNPLVPHDVFAADRPFTGIWELRWHVPESSPVSVGSGRFRLDGPSLVAEIVRDAAGRPAIPGASLKGAARQIFEFLTPSCEPGGRDSCRVRPSDSNGRLCPACSLFGAPGYGGRLAVSEACAAPAGVGGATSATRDAPVGWQPQRSVPQTLRTYDLGAATFVPPGCKMPVRSPVPERHDAAWGTFDGRVRFVNATELELAVLLMATGVAATLMSTSDGTAPVGLRVGGKKFHGWGSVSTELTRVCLLYPGRADFQGTDAALDWWQPIFERMVVGGDAARLAAWKALLDSWSAG